MKIQVVSKLTFQKGMDFLGITDDNVGDKNVAIISISEPKGYHHLKNNSNVLNIDFHDIDEPIEGFISFTTEMRDKILEFIERNREKKSLIVHCHAGISRSGAVGLAINDYLKQDYQEFITQNPKIIPNVLVTKIFKEL